MVTHRKKSLKFLSAEIESLSCEALSSIHKIDLGSRSHKNHSGAQSNILFPIPNVSSSTTAAAAAAAAAEIPTE